MAALWKTWVPAAFLEGGEGGGARIGQRGHHLTAANTLSAFGRFNQQREGVGGWVLSAFGQFNQRVGGEGGAVRFRPIQSVGGGCASM